MKKNQYILTTLLLIVLSPCILLYAQNNMGFNYQAVARDGDGKILINEAVTVNIGILNVDNANELLWEEQHQLLTNNQGLFSLVVGTDPQKKVDGAVESFSMIDWAGGDHSLFVKVAVGGGEFTDLGTSPIMAVPYAILSEEIRQPISKLTIGNADGVPQEEPLFEVRNSTGRPVFAVYEKEVWVYTDPEAKPSQKGGFAVGGYRTGKQSLPGQRYFMVDPDSVRVYINQDPLKGIKGGFAVGGYRTGKAEYVEYLSISKDSTRMFVNSNSEDPRRGGFVIRGESVETGERVPFLFMTPVNYFIGEGAGRRNKTGLFNTFLGFQAGEHNETGSQNLLIGLRSGSQLVAGSNNVYLGNFTGQQNEGGNDNVFIGNNAGRENFGSGNVFLGSNAGSLNPGSNNVFIGNNAGDLIQGSNLFVLENGTRDEAGSLMVGRFDHDMLRINAFMGINAKPDSAFAITTEGNIEATEITSTSDVRLKKEINEIENAIALVSGLNGITYQWNTEDYPERKFEGGTHLGFIAQEVEKVMPELVRTNSKGYKSVNYTKVSTILVEAVKEQQRMIEERDHKISDLEERIERLESLVGAE